MNLAASAILDESEKEVLDNAHALLSCQEQWSNPIKSPNELNMPDLLPTERSDRTANNIDLHPVHWFRKNKGTEDHDEMSGGPASGEYTSFSFLENFVKNVDWLSCTAILNSIQRPRMAILLRLRLECSIVETLLSHFTDVHICHGQSMPPAQKLYHVSREGVENLQPIPVGRAKPWKSLPKVASASLDTWLLRCGDVVSVNLGHGRGYAKVSDLRSINDGRYIVVYTWLYTRDKVAEELQVDGSLSPSSRAHLDKMWPSKARYKYMLSTKRIITLWDTAI